MLVDLSLLRYHVVNCRLMSEPSTASSPKGARVYRGCPAGTHTCAPDAQAVWHRSQSALVRASVVRRVVL